MISLYLKSFVFSPGIETAAPIPVPGYTSKAPVSIRRQPFPPPRMAVKQTLSGLVNAALTTPGPASAGSGTGYSTIVPSSGSNRAICLSLASKNLHDTYETRRPKLVFVRNEDKCVNQCPC